MPKNEDVSAKILNIVKNSCPDSVEKLAVEAQKELGITKELAYRHIISLQNDGKLILSSPPEPVPKVLGDYLFSFHVAWFWIIIILSISTTIAVFTIAENSYPLVYIRYVLGTVFVLFLPGYSLIKTLFPTKEIDNIERTALSIGMSLALVPLVGLLLNYTPWGIRVTPVTLSLLSLTIILTATGILREHQTRYPEPE